MQGLWRNKAGATMDVTAQVPWNPRSGFRTLGSIWYAYSPGLFGDELFLVTEESLKACGYKKVGT